jgi:hypothetical protein
MPRECFTFVAIIIFLCCYAAITPVINGLLPVYAQTTTNHLTVNVESDTYSIGDTVVITGRLDATVVDQPLLIQVLDPEGNRDRIDQVDVASDGRYRYSFTAGGLINTVGVYKIQVSYKGSTYAETSFVYDFPELHSLYRIVIDGQEYFIQYLIMGRGNELLNITTDFSRNATSPGDAWLIVSLSTQSDGTLSLKFSKEFFDANNEFLASIEGRETKVRDEGDEINNVIGIDFEAGTKEIRIVGDHVIPEFGLVFVPLLLASVIGLSVAYSRLRRY